VTAILVLRPAAYREGLQRWAAVLRAGGVTAFPTDTVWGIGALAAHAAAVERIYGIKRRLAAQPVACLVPGEAGARRWFPDWPPAVAELTARHWPGPLTLVLPTDGLPLPAVQRGVAKLGVRVPARRALLDLLEILGEPLAATSANRSGRPDLAQASDVLAKLGAELDLIVDDETPLSGSASTVIEWDGVRLGVLRAGAVGLP
jgi:L-threonylcarbamoyladenylate synthase